MFLNSLHRNLCKQKLKKWIFPQKRHFFGPQIILKIQECIYYSECEKISSKMSFFSTFLNVSMNFELDEKWSFWRFFFTFWLIYVGCTSFCVAYPDSWIALTDIVQVKKLRERHLQLILQIFSCINSIINTSKWYRYTYTAPTPFLAGLNE